MAELDDENVDEILVDTSFLFGDGESCSSFGNSIVAGDDVEECDPLMLDSSSASVQYPLECPTPTTTSASRPFVPLILKRKTIGVTTRSARKDSLLPQKSSGTPTTSASQVPDVPNNVPASNPPLPSVFKAMTFPEFTLEMEQNIHNVVKESVGLFDRHPREYHPFYLRIFKYLTIGQRLGYIATDEAYVNSIWTGFFKFADAQYEASTKKRSTSFTGEKSPYATFILTRKLVVNGQVIIEKRNEGEILKQLKEIEAKAQRIREEWDADAGTSSQENIEDDYRIRLKFFKECMTIIHPADCIKMNKLWTKFLSKEGFSECASGSDRNVIASAREAPLSVVKGKTKSPIPVVTIPCDDEVIQVEDDKNVNRSRNEASTEEESRKSLRKFIIKVIVAPPSSSTVSSTSVPSSLAVPSCRSPSPQLSPPCSPACSEVPSPPPSPEPAAEQPSCSTLVESERTDSSHPPEKKNVKHHQIPLRKAGKIINNKFAQRRTIILKKGTAVNNKLWPTGTSTVRKICATTKKPVMTTNALRKKKSKLFGILCARKMKNTNSEQVSRQVQLEKIINQPPSKVLSSVVKKNRVRNVSTKRTPSGIGKIEKQPGTNKTHTISNKSAPSKGNTIKTGKLVKQSLKNGRKKTDTTIVKRKTTSNKLSSLIEKRRKRRGMTKKKEVNSEKLQEKLERVINRVEKPDEKNKRTSLRRKTKKSVKTKPHPDVEKPEINVTTEVNEQAECVSLPQSPSPTNSNEKEQTEHSHVIKSSSTDTEVKDHHDKPSEGTSSKKSKLLQCDGCDNYFQASYLPIHKQIKHNPDRPKVKCPVPTCTQEFADHKLSSMWAHFCEYHLTESEPLQVLDPVSKLSIDGGKPFPAARKSKRQPEHTSTMCYICAKDFYNAASLERHMLQIHGEGEPIEENLECQYCKFVFKAKDTLMAHVKRIHEGKIKSKCQHCGKDLQAPGKLWRHLIDNHGVSASEAADYCEVEFVPCSLCGELMLEGRQLNNHMRNQHPEFEIKKMSSIEKKREQRRQWKELGIGPAWIQREGRGRGRGPGRGRYRPASYQSQEEMKNCPIEDCPVSVISVRSLKAHIRNKHSSNVDRAIVESKIVKVVEKTNSYNVHLCTLCGKYLRHFDEVKVHMVASHPRIFANLIGGNDNVPSPLVPPPPPPQLPCPHCSFTCSKDEDVRCHVEQAHVEMCWRCPECSKVMLSPDDFEEHFDEEHCGKRKKDIGDNEISNFVKVIEQCISGKGKNATQKENEIQRSKVDFDKVLVSCEICCRQVKLKSLVGHLKTLHQVQEDLEPLLCSLCPGLVPFNIYKERGRCLYLDHMEKHHKDEVDIEEMIKVIGTVYTKVNWRTLQNIRLECKFGGGWRRKRTKPDDDDYEETSSGLESDNEQLALRKNGRKKSRSLLQRAVQRGQRRRIRDKASEGYSVRKTKFSRTKVSCEVCKMQQSMTTLSRHIKKVHDLDEEPLCCKICSTSFNIQEFWGRSGYLVHMEKYHGGEVDMQEMIQLMSKVHTKEDWRTLEIKNPEGIKTGTIVKRVRQGRRPKRLDGSKNEEGFSEVESNTEKSDCKKSEHRSKSSVNNMIHRRRKADKSEKELLTEREYELKRKREVFSFYSKYGRFMLTCPIGSCRWKIRLVKFSSHLKIQHDVCEDGKIWLCPICGKKILRRDSWLGHIDMQHGDHVNMKEFIEKAKQPHPDVKIPEGAVITVKRVKRRSTAKAPDESDDEEELSEEEEESGTDNSDWEKSEQKSKSLLKKNGKKAEQSHPDVEIPEGVSTGKRNEKRVKRKRKAKASDESEDEEELSEEESSGTDHSDWEESEEKSKSSLKKSGKTVDNARKGKVRQSLPVRVSGRNRAKPVKYAEFFNEDEQNQSDIDEGIPVKRNTNSRKGTSGRLTKSVEIVSACQKEKETGPRVSLKKSVEKEKRLIIKLTRLTEEELRRHLNCRQLDSPPENQLEKEDEDEDVIVKEEWPVAPPESCGAEEAETQMDTLALL